MPVMRIGYDDNIASTLGSFANQIGASWDPKARVEAMLLQQKIWEHNRQMAAQQAAINATQRYHLTPAQSATINNMYLSGASQSDIDEELSRYSPIAAKEINDARTAAAAATSSGTARGTATVTHEEEARKAGVVLEDAPPNATPAQVAAVTQRNVQKVRSVGLPDTAAVDNSTPNLIDYQVKFAEHQKFVEARQAARGGGLEATKAYPGEEPGVAMPTTAAPAAMLPGTNVPISAVTSGRPVTGPAAAAPAQPNADAIAQTGPLAPSGATTAADQPGGGIIVTPGQPKATTRESIGNIKEIEEMKAAGKNAKQAQTAINQIGALAGVIKPEGAVGQLSAEEQDKLRKAGLVGITTSQQAAWTLDAIANRAAAISPDIDAALKTGIPLSRVPRPALFPILATAATNAQDAWDRRNDAVKLSGRSMTLEQYDANETARANTHDDRTQTQLDTYSKGLPELISKPLEAPPAEQKPGPPTTQSGPEGPAGPAPQPTPTPPPRSVEPPATTPRVIPLPTAETVPRTEQPAPTAPPPTVSNLDEPGGIPWHIFQGVPPALAAPPISAPAPGEIVRPPPLTLGPDGQVVPMRP